MSEGNGMLRTSHLAHITRRPVRKWIVNATGFTQSLGKANGFDGLWLDLRSLSNGETEVLLPLEWNSEWEELADRISRCADQFGIEPDIRMNVYSWAGGYAFPTFAKALGKRGLKIHGVCACDPVYYRWGRWWRAIVFSPEIVVPENVEQVVWLRQFQNYPRATELVAADPSRTLIYEPVIVERNHQWMDDAREFHQMALAMAKAPRGSDGRLNLPLEAISPDPAL